MNTGISEFILFGMIALAGGIVLLLGIVFELKPTIRRKWLLGVALGTGIIAFGIKLVMIVAFSNYSTEFFEIFSPDKKEKENFVDYQYFSSPDDEHQLATAYTWEALPKVPPVPANNPMTMEKIELGKTLFFDKRLSADNTVACASCHELSSAKGGADGLAVSIGINAQKGTRNAPSVINSAFQQVLFWDGRAKSLEEQAKGPIINPLEMGMSSWKDVEKKLAEIPEYQEDFALVFPEDPKVNIDNIAKAIATYERTLISNNSAYDRFVLGDRSALSEEQIRGMALFESKGCVFCHSGPNFSSASVFASTGLYRMFPATAGSAYEEKYDLSDDRGLNAGIAGADRGIWRVPSLRNVSRTAPYFHNGSVDNLEEAVRIMAHVQLGKTISNELTDQQKLYWLSDKQQMSVSNNSSINDAEVKEIVAFLKSLNGDVPANTVQRNSSIFGGKNLTINQ